MDGWGGLIHWLIDGMEWNGEEVEVVPGVVTGLWHLPGPQRLAA